MGVIDLCVLTVNHTLTCDLMNCASRATTVSPNPSFARGIFEGGQRRGRQLKCWMDNIKEWTTLPIPGQASRGNY